MGSIDKVIAIITSIANALDIKQKMEIIVEVDIALMDIRIIISIIITITENRHRKMELFPRLQKVKIYERDKNNFL